MVALAEELLAMFTLLANKQRLIAKSSQTDGHTECELWILLGIRSGKFAVWLLALLVRQEFF
jgi:hypothetical protein